MDWKKNIKSIYKHIIFLFLILLILFKAVENFDAFLSAIKSGFSSVVAVLSPFIWGLCLSFLLSPISNKIESFFYRQKFFQRKKNLTRGISIFLSMIFLLLILALIVYASAILISGNIQKISIQEFQDTLYQNAKNILNTLQNIEEPLSKLGLPPEVNLAITNAAHNIYDTAFKIVQAQLGNAITLSKTIATTIFHFAFGLVFAYNLMFHKEYFLKLYHNTARFLLPKSLWASFASISKEFYQVLRHFVRALFLDLSLISFVTFLSLLILGEQYAFLTGLFAGYTNIIPYLGTWIGIIPAMLVALVTKGVSHAIFIGLYIVVIQQIYITIVSPKVKGDSMGVHPLFVLLAFFIFGALFGLWGTVLALPLAGMIKVLFSHWIKATEEKKNIRWE